MELLPMHSWHPMVIHFPLVGLLAAVALDLRDAWSRSSRFRLTATFFWWIGLLGAGAAIITGLLAYDRVEHSDLAHLQMTLHRNLALGTAFTLALTALWRWRRPFSRGAACLGVVGAGSLLWVGYLGGELVFRHAIGVPTETVEEIIHERGGREDQDGGNGMLMEHRHEGAQADSTPASGGALPESSADTTHHH